MQETSAMEFYERLTQGTERYEEITIEQDNGMALGGFEVHPVSKKELAGVIERLPEEMFEAAQDAEDAEAAEQEIEQSGGDLSAITEETVEAFEDLVAESLRHPEFTNTQIRKITQELDFERLFELGTKIINMSVEETGSIRNFHEQD